MQGLNEKEQKPLELQIPQCKLSKTRKVSKLNSPKI